MCARKMALHLLQRVFFNHRARQIKNFHYPPFPKPNSLISLETNVKVPRIRNMLLFYHFIIAAWISFFLAKSCGCHGNSKEKKEKETVETGKNDDGLKSQQLE